LSYYQNTTGPRIKGTESPTRYTFGIAGAFELGPLDEKNATFANTGLPTIVLEGLNFTTGDLHIANQTYRV
jgi:hypothetical protein